MPHAGARWRWMPGLRRWNDLASKIVTSLHPGTAHCGNEAPPFKSPAIRFAYDGLDCPRNVPCTESIRLRRAYTARRERCASGSKDPFVSRHLIQSQRSVSPTSQTMAMKETAVEYFSPHVGRILSTDGLFASGPKITNASNPNEVTIRIHAIMSCSLFPGCGSQKESLASGY